MLYVIFIIYNLLVYIKINRYIGVYNYINRCKYSYLYMFYINKNSFKE